MKTELSIAENLEAISALAPEISEQLPYLQMLILFGSRATGKATDTSDFDLAVSYDEDLQEKFTKDKPYGFIEAYSVIPKVLGMNSDRLDIVDLGHCSDVIAHFVAQDGKLLYERELGYFEKFKQNALMSDRQLHEIQQQIANRIRLSLARR